MSKKTPDSYKPGVDRIEEMTKPVLREWLNAELRGQMHILAGKEEDYPVQAIVNHHPYLSIAAQQRVGDALEALVLDWRKELSDWPEAAVRALLSLVAELRVEGAKPKLVRLVSDKEMWGQIPALQPAVLRALATLSLNEDRAFWNKLPNQYPKFAGMAFQVLTRIAAEDALQLLSRLPDNDAAVGSVARKLPDFVSQFQPERKPAVLACISRAIAKLPEKSAETLTLALQNAGIEILLPSSPSKEKEGFLKSMRNFAKHVRSTNRSPLELEHA